MVFSLFAWREGGFERPVNNYALKGRDFNPAIGNASPPGFSPEGMPAT